MTKLRPALAGDAPSLAVLAERTFRETFGTRNSPENMDLHCAKAFGTDIQLREIGDRELRTTIAEAEGQMIEKRHHHPRGHRGIGSPSSVTKTIAENRARAAAVTAT